MRSLRPWHLLLVLAALAVPLQAGALPGGGDGAPPSALSVTASLGECGVSESGISCRIDASWSGVEGANRYTATVTLADGSVTDMGTVGTGGGSASFWVPYVGNGIYTVTVTAWGTDADGRDKKLDEEDAEAEKKPKDRGDKKEDKSEKDGKDESAGNDRGDEDAGGGQDDESEPKPGKPAPEEPGGGGPGGKGGEPPAPESDPGEGAEPEAPAEPAPDEPADPAGATQPEGAGPGGTSDGGEEAATEQSGTGSG